MSVSKKRPPAAPLGIIGSIIAGFELVNTQLGLVLLPLALDLWLWLGPRLSILPLAEQAAGMLDQLLVGPDAEALRPSVAGLQRSLLELGERQNLFGYLSTAPLGLPSLLAARGTNDTPFGPAVLWKIDNPLVYLVLVGMLVVAGLWAGALFFGLLAQQAGEGRVDVARLARQVWGDWVRFIALSVLLALVALVLGAPLLFLSALMDLISPALGSLLSIIGATLLLWALIFGGFAPHGVTLQRRGLRGALWDSVRLVRSSLPQTAGLYASLMVLNLGLGLVWAVPAGGSWWMIFGVGGHALVTTALYAATFVYYKDRYRWWVETHQSAAPPAA